MKKFIIFLLAATVLSAGSLEAKKRLLSPYDQRTREELKFNASVYGGYNFTGAAPVYGGIVAVESYFLRADLDFGGTTINHPLCDKHFTTFGPSLGVFVGENYKMYAMYGFQTYATIATTAVTNCPTDQLYTDNFYHKLKFGFQATVWERMFVSVELARLFPVRKAGFIVFPNTSANVGVGWKF